MALAQSGPRLFAIVRTAATPGTVAHAALDHNEINRIASRVATGRTSQPSSRTGAQITAASPGFACREGAGGVRTRV